MGFKLMFLAIFLVACSKTPTKIERELASAEKNSTALRLGRDQGPLGPFHDHVSQEFVEENLKLNGNYDLEKIDSFLSRLEKEKASMKEDMYETQLIEDIELGFTTYEIAKKNALKEIDEEKNELLFSYNEYLIPKIKTLRELVVKESSTLEMDGVVDDFLRLYVSFYIPNKKRTPFDYDREWETYIKRYIKPFNFKSYDPTKAEASNLMVEESLETEINDCLPVDVKPGHYLSPGEVSSLEKCGMDISKLNPGVSALWQPITEERLKEIRAGRPELFPNEKEKIFLRGIKLSGSGSPKLDVEFIRGDKKIRMKLKVGPEVHTDNLTSLMGSLLGFTQDIMSHREKVRVYLGKTSFQSFKNQFSRKYGLKSLTRYIDAHGGEEGQEWIDLSDVLFEGNIEEEIRLVGLSSESWDLINRREYRALLLWYGFFNIIDTKPNNFKLILKKAPDGTLFPVHRLQDVGNSLGKGHHFRGGLIDYLSGTGELGSINSFLPSFLKYDGKSVQIFWNDFRLLKRRFSGTTWHDLKWMARNIARVKDEDIQQMIAISNVPEVIRDLFRHKIVSRRNEIVKAFGLENEFEIYPVPDLKSYSPNDSIKDGKVILSYHEGHHESWAGENDVLGNLVEMINFENPFGPMIQNLNEKTEMQLTGNLAGLGAGISTRGQTKMILEGDELAPISVLSTVPGLAVQISRSVGNNPQKFDSPDYGGGRFYIKDSLTFKIDFRMPFLKTIGAILPTNFSGNLKIYSKRLEFIHYAGSLREAYKKPFKLFHLLRGLKTYAAEELNRLEILKNEDSYGFGLDGRVSAFSLGPIITNEAGIKVGWIRTTPAYLLRDQFGVVHVYKEKSNDLDFGFHSKLGNIGLKVFEFPLLGMDFTYNRFFFEAADYSFNIPNIKDQGSVLDLVKTLKETDALKVLLERGGDEAVSSKARRNYQLLAEGDKTAINLAMTFFFRAKLNRGHSKIGIELKDGSTRGFYRYYIKKSATLGIQDLPDPEKDQGGPGDLEQPLIFRGKSVQIISELDDKDPKNFVSMIRYQEYYQTRKKDQLEELIDDQNKRFSEDDNQEFYRNYILPEPEKIKKYWKVYPHTRIFVNAHALVEKVKNTSEEEIKAVALASFKDAIIEKQLGKNPFRKTKTRFRAHRLVTGFKMLKEAINSGEKKAIIEKVSSFLEKTYTEILGIGLLKNFLGKDNIYVMGNIYGIHQSFSNIEDEGIPTATSRFAGKSWGTYSVIPPVEKFLFSEGLIKPSVFISSQIPTYDIFGSLPNGMTLIR